MIVEHTFSCDTQTLYQLLTNPDFLSQRALALGSIEADCQTQEGDNGGCVVSLARVRKINIPSVLKTLLKEVQTANSTDKWQSKKDRYSCESFTQIDGAPLEIEAKITISPVPDGCLYQADFKTDAKVMMFGKKLERYAEKTVAKEIELECEYLQSHLSELA